MDTTNSSKIYLIMNKPCGYVCSAVSDSHKTVYELLPGPLRSLAQNAKRGKRLHTVGRLDCETGGLLLFTTDGDFSNYLTRPEHHIQKTYEAELKYAVDDALQPEYIQKAARGVTLPAEKKAPEQKSAGAQLQFLSPTRCIITITEGKFHEVRRLLKALGNEVSSLNRTAIGRLCLPPDLTSGTFRALTAEERKLIFDR
jgi:16S rRNA pseudouridine516 synthase